MKQEEEKAPQIQIQKVKPRYIPMICPVCNGHTTVNYGRLPCKACNQRGYIEVPPEEDERY